MTRKHILAFKDKLMGEAQSAANTNVKLGNLNTLLQWASDNDYSEIIPGKAVSVITTPV
ncbi:hypothetical protein BH10PSE14_BH10PSE14_17920 [soil metagenome]